MRDSYLDEDEFKPVAVAAIEPGIEADDATDTFTVQPAAEEEERLEGIARLAIPEEQLQQEFQEQLEDRFQQERVDRQQDFQEQLEERDNNPVFDGVRVDEEENKLLGVSRKLFWIGVLVVVVELRFPRTTMPQLRNLQLSNHQLSLPRSFH
jgi:hypothetical protein